MKFYVEKSTKIEASLSRVRQWVEDFNRWNSWSPWVVVEPDCLVTVNGEPGQAGHRMHWDGEVIGSGVNTLVESSPDQLTYDLEFIKPFKSQAKVSFTFAIDGDATSVTWKMDSAMPFFLFFMIPTMKNWIGMDYERGLRMLKAMVEQGEVKAETTHAGIVAYEGFSYVGIKRSLPIEDMPQKMQADFERIVNDIVVERGKGARHWVALYPKWDFRRMTATYIAAVSDEDLQDEDLGPDYVSGSIKSGQCLEVKHKGAYDFLGNAWSMGMMTIRAKKLKTKGAPFEQYWNSPLEVAPEALETSVFLPVK